MAGKRKTDTAAVKKATADFHRALKQAAHARRRLARATRPGAPYKVVAKELQWADEVLAKHRKKLLALPGVVGIGLSTALKNNESTGEPCIAVFVEKKRTPSELRRKSHRLLPKTLRLEAGSKPIRVDVVELPDVKLHAGVGASIGPSGDPLNIEGTLGVFARDQDTDRNVAITAMHVTGSETFTGAVAFCIPSLRRHLPTVPLGDLTFGTTDGVDAAKIDLDDQSGVDNGEIDSWRPAAVPGDKGTSVSMAGAVSKNVSGTIVAVGIDLIKARIDAAIIANIQSQEGDSGAALLDENKHVLGFLVGRAVGGPYDGFKVFCSAAAVVDQLNVDF